MAPEPLDDARWLAVRLEHADAQTREVLEILRERGIPTEVVHDGDMPREPGVVLFQIPGERLKEAMLSLGIHGFSDVRAYGGRWPVGGARGSWSPSGWRGGELDARVNQPRREET